MNFEILEFKPLTKNTLRGFFSVRLPSQMIIHNLTLHEKGASRWVGMPAQKYAKQGGATGWTPIIEFAAREASDKFRDFCLAALDAKGFGRQRRSA